MSDFSTASPVHAWVYLNRVLDGPSHALAGLLTAFEPERIAHGVFHREEWIGALLGETASRYDWCRQSEDLECARQVASSTTARLMLPRPSPLTPCHPMRCGCVASLSPVQWTSPFPS